MSRPELPPEFVDRSIRYVGQLASIAAAGLMETFTQPKPRSWWEFAVTDLDIPYQAGHLAHIAAWGVAALAAVYTPWLFIPAAALLVSAFFLCWWFA